MSSPPPPPPPYLTVPYYNNNNNNANTYNNNNSTSTVASPSMQGINPALIKGILILSLTVIISTSLCLLLRFLTRYFHHHHHDTSATSTTNILTSRLDSLSSRHRFSASLLHSLPLFSFRSASVSSGDCAVCLSKFEPHDLLRLLPICCHAFHADCIDTWLQSNQTCPLCRSPISASDSDILDKVLQSSSAAGTGDSFRVEIGNVSRRQPPPPQSDSGEARRSYSLGSFDYVVEDETEVSVESTHVRRSSEYTCGDKDEAQPQTAEEESVAAEVGGGGRSWLRDYVERMSASLSSRAVSFRSSGRIFTGSSRRSDFSGAVEIDLEANRVGEEISELFRWLSGV